MEARLMNSPNRTANSWPTRSNPKQNPVKVRTHPGQGAATAWNRNPAEDADKNTNTLAGKTFQLQPISTRFPGRWAPAPPSARPIRTRRRRKPQAQVQLPGPRIRLETKSQQSAIQPLRLPLRLTLEPVSPPTDPFPRVSNPIDRRTDRIVDAFTILDEH
jgi:hypothetical protein